MILGIFEAIIILDYGFNKDVPTSGSLDVLQIPHRMIAHGSMFIIIIRCDERVIITHSCMGEPPSFTLADEWNYSGRRF